MGDLGALGGPGNELGVGGAPSHEFFRLLAVIMVVARLHITVSDLVQLLALGERWRTAYFTYLFGTLLNDDILIIICLCPTTDRMFIEMTDYHLL